MRFLPAAWLVFLALGSASALDDAPQGDLAKFQGRWVTVFNKEIPLALEIKGQAATATFTTPDGEKVTIKGEIRIDEKARPKGLDWVKFKAQDGEDLPDNLAIYEFDADSLKVCNGGPDNPRPTEFKEGAGGAPSLLIFKRERGENKGQPATP